MYVILIKNVGFISICFCVRWYSVTFLFYAIQRSSLIVYIKLLDFASGPVPVYVGYRVNPFSSFCVKRNEIYSTHAGGLAGIHVIF